MLDNQVSAKDRMKSDSIEDLQLSREIVAEFSDRLPGLTFPVNATFLGTVLDQLIACRSGVPQDTSEWLYRGAFVMTPTGKKAEVYNITQDGGVFTSQGNYCATELSPAHSPSPYASVMETLESARKWICRIPASEDEQRELFATVAKIDAFLGDTTARRTSHE